MPSFSTTRRVGHSAANMFELVADAEKYPQFVPPHFSWPIYGMALVSQWLSLVVVLAVSFFFFSFFTYFLSYTFFR